MAKSREITLTLEDVVNAQPYLASVLSVKVNEQLRYHVMKLDGFVESHHKHFSKRNEALIEEFEGVERQPTGAERARFPNVKFYDIPLKNTKAFVAKKAELLAVEVTIPWGPITRAMVEPYEEITGAICKGLGALFELDPAEDKEQAA